MSLHGCNINNSQGRVGSGWPLQFITWLCSLFNHHAKCSGTRCEKFHVWHPAPGVLGAFKHPPLYESIITKIRFFATFSCAIAALKAFRV